MKRSRRIAAVLASTACALAHLSSNAAPVPVTLCSPTETVLFSCKIGRKNISVCATKELNDRIDSVFYRFGSQTKLEMVYPSEEKHPSKTFTGYFEHGARTYLTEISFTKGNITYVVHQYFSTSMGEWAGVGVYRGKQRLSKLGCSEDPINELFKLEKLGLNSSDPHEDLLPF